MRAIHVAGRQGGPCLLQKLPNLGRGLLFLIVQCSADPVQAPVRCRKSLCRSACAGRLARRSKNYLPRSPAGPGLVGVASLGVLVILGRLWLMMRLRPRSRRERGGTVCRRLRRSGHCDNRRRQVRWSDPASRGVSSMGGREAAGSAPPAVYERTRSAAMATAKRRVQYATTSTYTIPLSCSITAVCGLSAAPVNRRKRYPKP